MFNKDSFYDKAKDLFDLGLLKELVTTDQYSLCNLANSMYVLIYGLADEYGIGGLFIEPEQAKKIAYNPDYFMKLMVFYKEHNALESRHVFLNQNTLDNIIKFKKQTDLEGPTKYVDLEFENELLEKSKSL